MKLSERKIDLQKREEGAWVTDIPDWQGLSLKVRGSDNKDWARMENKLWNAVPRARKINGRDPEDVERINAILLRETSLLDWRGVDDDDGKPEPYSKTAADKYLTPLEMEPFRRAVMWAAVMVAEIGRAELEDDAKN